MSLSHCVSLCVVTLSWPSSAPLLVLIVHVKYDLRSTHKPAIYRAVIDDVIASIKHEFDEYGVGEEVLAELQHKWEAKVIASHVAEFEPPPPPQAVHPPPQHSPHPAHAVHPHHAQPMAHQHSMHPQYPPHPMHAHPQYHPYHPYPPPPPPGPQIKAEPMDHRYVLSPPPYGIPTLPGPQIPGGPPRPGGQVMTFPSAPRYAPPPQAPSPVPPAAAPPAQKNGATAATNGRIPQVDGPSSASGSARIPQVDGPSSSSSGSDSSSPPPPAYAPRGAVHPSLPQPAQQREDASVGDEAINSDLDDSDSDNEREEGGSTSAETDIVFCTYDKVARVKNKWKCILKDGMIHVNGKDYLFAKCTGEFEW
ncbi:hypothetical protein PHLCEN_2v4222 [Hermanssonia centrifuga]|uniref:Uncharacterized protein n=1 Tax=Hermanssonia centrifuga TaxID=98765 RepID=A0A2R6PYX8_9APHY|nr:hypothetical protein PHLCEN_2v4222 [Hermanssonia centrifuga]